MFFHHKLKGKKTKNLKKKDQKVCVYIYAYVYIYMCIYIYTHTYKYIYFRWRLTLGAFNSVFVFNIYFPALKFASILRNSRVGSQFFEDGLFNRILS